MNIKTLGVLLATSLLLACSSPQGNGWDDTAISGAEFDRSGQGLIVTVHVYPNLIELNRSRDQWFVAHKKQPPQHRALGWTVWSPSDNICDIHIQKLDGASTMATAGHELAHCLYGAFHEE